MLLPKIFITSVAILVCLATTASGEAKLSPEEVETLKQIAVTLGKTNWNFSVDPCSGQSDWITLNPEDGFDNGVYCNCSFLNNTVCHVVRIVLKRQSLPGKLPLEIIWLPYLQELDLTRNYLNGTIPPEWGSTKLVNVSLLGNRLSGPIPKELGNITTLANLEFTSNNLSGQLPSTLANLSTLKDFRIGDNQFFGSIPTFIQSWTNLQKLIIQGSGLDGPIPPGIASLTELTDLDLSFNRIRGTLPSRIFVAKDADFVYLTGNLLNGSVPEWILKRGFDIDLSYNNFTVLPNSTKANLNLFNSKSNLMGIDSCKKSSARPQYQYSFHINCGGKKYEIGNKRFEDDTERGGAANYFQSSTNWAVSSTGHFLDDKERDSYTVPNRSSICGKNSQLYMDARVSPLSLTYYGFCLGNGNYTVELHFAEIIFSDDRNYSSLGRRVFDIYIQGKLMKKDFNIEDEAGGVNKAIVKYFGATVIDNTLTIRFYWAGRGTIDIPDRGVYGPLISAISVYSDAPENRALSAGAVAGIVIAVLFMISLFMFVLWRKCFIADTVGKDFEGLDLQTGSFTLRKIKAATNNFDVANKIGEGGFGSVYKGNLSNGRIVAVKQLSSKSQQGNREFVNEIGMISAVQHPNLVKLYGCCIEANQLLLVYEFMENNSLARALFGPKEQQLKLDWPARHNICVGMARGLAYLHEESRLKIIHRDIKATNVLLDKNLNPKISDFGLAKLHEEDTSHISTRIAGTFGYMAPEYAMRGHLTDKADVYSFGIVVLEIVSGRCNTSIIPKEDRFYVLDWAHLLKEEGKLMELVDPRLESDFDHEQVMWTINVALLCTEPSPDVRPSMSMVVSMLEGQADQKLISASSLSGNTIKLKEMGDIQPVTGSSQSQTLSVSTDVPGTASSTSTGDLYPVLLNSDTWPNQKEYNSLLR